MSVKRETCSQRTRLSGAGSPFTHLDEGNLAGADVAFEIADRDLAVMLQVALLTQHIVDAGHNFVPLIVVSKPGQQTIVLSLCTCGSYTFNRII